MKVKSLKEGSRRRETDGTSDNVFVIYSYAGYITRNKNLRITIAIFKGIKMMTKLRNFKKKKNYKII